MSLGGALSTAGLGLSALSEAMSTISQNIANAQTVGYKEVGTDFSTLMNVSGAEVSGGVTAKTFMRGDAQGSVQNTSVNTNLAVQGDGYFSVSAANGISGPATTFSPQKLYTRAGDFILNKDGYMVNGAGYYLNGYPMTSTGTPNTNALQPIQIVSRTINPSQTQDVTYAANLPSTISGGLPPQLSPTQISFLDAQGQTHTLTAQWATTNGSDFTLQLSVPTSDPNVQIAGLDTPAPPAGTTLSSYIQQLNTPGSAAATAFTPNTLTGADFQFNHDGTLRNIAPGATAGSAAAAATPTAGTPASMILTVNFPNSTPPNATQKILLNFGKYATQGTLTNYSGTDVNFAGEQQDGTPAGNFTGVTVSNEGVVTASYDNGAKKALYQVPVALFPNYDGLQAQNGNSFQETVDSGQAVLQLPGSNSAGKIIGAAIENSTADIAQEFSKLIQTQNAYTANTRVVTVTNQMFQSLNQVVQ